MASGASTQPARGAPILFRVAAGPRIGSGHLVRALRLADLSGLAAAISVRGAHAARLQIESGRCTRLQAGSPGQAFDKARPSLLVIDDPSEQESRAWMAAARERRCPVAAIVDFGIGCRAADVVFDGSVARPIRPEREAHTVRGPRYAVIDPVVGRAGRNRTAGPQRTSIFIALGGGYRRRFALRLATTLGREVPGVDVVVGGGFMPTKTRTVSAGTIKWLGPQRSLASWLSAATVAVVGGGVTLYEACAAGASTVAVPIVPLQRPPIAAMKRLGAVACPSLASDTPDVAEVAALVKGLIHSAAQRRRLSRQARVIVDGRGLYRVAQALRRLALGEPAAAVLQRLRSQERNGGH